MDMRKQSDRMSDYVTMQEAAQILGISRPSLYYAIKQGRLTPVKQFSRTLLRRAEVEAYEPAGYLDRRPSKSPRKKTMGEGTVTNGR
jgi:excisionase family DNA binding protein